MIEEHEASGLTAAAFCRERGVNAKYFSLRKKQLSINRSSPFVPVQAKPPVDQDIRIDVNGVCVVLSSSLSPDWVANFIKQLSE